MEQPGRGGIEPGGRDRRSRGLRELALATLLLSGAACAAPADRVDEAALEAAVAALEVRFTPGLHTLMTQLQHRHANLWFAGNASNWALADYMLHELEELVEEVEELHPVYEGVQVALLLGEMTRPAMERLEEAVDGQDLEGFRRAFDALTSACNGCHLASDHGAIVIQRPTTPPLDNLRFQP